MAPSGDDVQAIETRVADLERELGSLKAVLSATERLAEASEAGKERFRRVSQGAVALATLLLLLIVGLASRKLKR